MPGGIGPLELGIVLLIILLIFGPKRLPGLGKSLGTGMREFKDSITGRNKDDDDDAGLRELDPAAREDARPVGDDGDRVEGEVVSERRT